MSASQEASLLGSVFSPPDTQVAAGPNSLVEMVNSIGSIFSKSGTLTQTFSLAAFFNAPSGYFLSDPRVMYDAPSQRWFATGVVLNLKIGSEVQLAVSSTADPAGTWNLYTLESNTSGVLYDQPRTGLSADKVVVSWNDFTPNLFTGQETFVVQKSDVLAGATAHVSRFGPDLSRQSIVPAQSLSATNTEYLSYNNSCSSDASCTTGSSAIGVVAITGTPSQSNVLWTESDPSIVKTSVPPNALQPRSAPAISTNDDRFLTANWQNGVLWAAGNDGCVPGRDNTNRSCFRLVEVSTSSPVAVAQDFDVGLNGQYFYYPAVGLDSAGDMFVVGSTSSQAVYPSVTFQSELAASSSLAGGAIIAAGAGDYSCGCGTENRWGDYSGVALDPAVPSDVWVASEFAPSSGTSGNWGTAIGRLTFVPAAIISVSASPGSVSAGHVVTVTASAQHLLPARGDTNAGIIINPTSDPNATYDGYDPVLLVWTGGVWQIQLWNTSQVKFVTSATAPACAQGGDTSWNCSFSYQDIPTTSGTRSYLGWVASSYSVIATQ